MVLLIDIARSVLYAGSNGSLDVSRLKDPGHAWIARALEQPVRLSVIQIGLSTVPTMNNPDLEAISLIERDVNVALSLCQSPLSVYLACVGIAGLRDQQYPYMRGA